MSKILLLLSIVILSVSFFIIKKNETSDNNDKRTVVNISFDKCNVQTNLCDIKLKELNLKISFDENIQYLKPFNISVLAISRNKIKVKSIIVDFKMKNMEMGINRFMLKNIDIQDFKWIGKALLPICITGRVEWSSEMVVETENYQYIISFPIIVKK